MTYAERDAELMGDGLTMSDAQAVADVPVTYAPDSIASFAAKVERVADDQQSLWYEQ